MSRNEGWTPVTVHVIYSWNSENARHEVDLDLPPGPRVTGEWELREMVARHETGQREDAQYLHIRDARVVRGS